MPKSRGRRKATSSKPVRRSPLPPRRSDLLLRDARQLTGLTDPLMAETWASGWLGAAWVAAELGEREAEHQLCMEVTGRASTTPSPHGLAAIAALARVAPATDITMLAETIDILAETQPLPPWHTAMSADTGWTAVAAWRAVDVWDSEQVLFIDYEGAHPHTLMAQILKSGGLMIDKIVILEPGAAAQWDQLREADEVPMPISQAPVADVLADLAAALRTTDITWPRNDDEDFVDNRALAWSRCRDHLPGRPEEDRLPEAERHRLIQQFTTVNNLDDEVSRSLAELFLDYGEGYIVSGPLAWSPTEVMLLLTDWLPRKAVLDAAQRTALPDVLRQWLTYALDERGVDTRWITPVVDAVDAHLPEFRHAFDDDTSWGPAKQIAAALTDRGVDLTDRQAVDDAIRALNAEQLARRLLP
ncbi:hypothetical protein ACFOY2_51560 [Nonomuraea purpurea]|uniref:Uncharacterized protein n=1 Tax=Nonomuraea purpurea TaxID=1849276 RepID=A0ABV8GSN9_9ACTN